MNDCAFFSIRKPKDPGTEVSKYKQIDHTNDDVITEWQVILL